MTSLINWRESKRKNTSRINFVLMVFVYLPLLFGFSYDIFIGTFPTITILMLLVVGAAVYVATSLHEEMMLAGLSYIRISSANKEYRIIYNLIEEMRISSGLRIAPRLYVAKTNCMNAFSSGYSDASSIIVLTEGLIKKLTRDELQAVIAHEMSHILNNDNTLILICTVFSLLFCSVLPLAIFSLVFAVGMIEFLSPDFTISYFVPIMMGMISLNALAIFLLPKFVGYSHELRADAVAVQLTRSRDPLASALNKVNYDHVINFNEYYQFYNSSTNLLIRNNNYFFEPLKSDAPLSKIYPVYPYPSFAMRIANIGAPVTAPAREFIQEIAPKSILVTSREEIEKLNKSVTHDFPVLRLDLVTLIGSKAAEAQKDEIIALIKLINNNSEFSTLDLVGFHDLRPDMQAFFIEEAANLACVTEFTISDNQNSSHLSYKAKDIYHNHELAFKKIASNNFAKNALSNQVESRVDIQIIVADLAALDEQKAALRELAKSLSAAGTTVLVIEGFYDISDELKEYFILMVETFPLSKAESITLINPNNPEASGKFSLTEAVDPYQLRMNGITNKNVIDPLFPKPERDPRDEWRDYDDTSI